MINRKLIEQFAAAARYLANKVETEGWTWTSNFLREFVRAKYAAQFTNSLSPEIMQALIENYPDEKFVKYLTQHNPKPRGLHDAAVQKRQPRTRTRTRQGLS